MTVGQLSQLVVCSEQMLMCIYSYSRFLLKLSAKATWKKDRLEAYPMSDDFFYIGSDYLLNNSFLSIKIKTNITLIFEDTLYLYFDKETTQKVSHRCLIYV